MSIERDIKAAFDDLATIIDDLPRRIATLHGCQPGPGRPDAAWSGPGGDDTTEPGAAPYRHPADNARNPEHDLRALVICARQAAAAAERVRKVLGRYTGTVVTTQAPSSKPKHMVLEPDWDGCVDCAQDTRQGRPYWTPVDDRRPELRLCDWCASSRLRWDVERVPVGLVCLHHDGRRISDQLAADKVAGAARRQPVREAPVKARQLGEYTRRAADEAAAMTASLEADDTGHGAA